MYRVKISPIAKLDYEECLKWYENISTSLIDKFDKEFDEMIDRLIFNPYIYQIKYDNVRAVKLKSFEHLVHYSIVDEVVLIKTILHSKRSPELPRSRK